MSELNKEVYDCMNCGACCRSFPVFASKSDGDREPRIKTEGQRIPEYLSDEARTFRLFPLPFHDECCFLKSDQLCSVYASRPNVCRCFEAGSAQCIEARRRQGIG